MDTNIYQMHRKCFYAVFLCCIIFCSVSEVYGVSNMSLLKKDDFLNVVSSLNIKVSGGDFQMPEDGRIANNIIIDTNMGKILIRSYDTSQTKLETGNCEFEVRALNFLANVGCNVPIPLIFKDSKLIRTYGDIKVFAYKMIPGNRITVRNLTCSEINKIGEFLNTFVSYSSTFDIKGLQAVPYGDQGHIRKIFKITCDFCKELTDDELFTSMLEICGDENVSKQLKNTPHGIVHADFFDENIVFDGFTYGLIDFGDAYYGAVINDIVIGAMEFSVIDNIWNFEFLDSFLTPLSGWLARHSINSSFFIQLLRLNCIRFLCYTLRFSDYKNYKENPYYIRYKDLTVDSKIIKQVQLTFENICKKG